VIGEAEDRKIRKTQNRKKKAENKQTPTPAGAGWHPIGVSYWRMKRVIFLPLLVLLALSTLPRLTAQSSGSKTSQKRSAQKQSAQKEVVSDDSEPAGADSSAPVKQDLKRLVLRDGSYQAVIKYQVIGDRVHFLSAERYDWEDIPSELVDWDASRKYMAQLAAAESSHVKEIDAEAAREKAEEDAQSPLIAPGIKLPPTGGIFLLDVYHDKPELNELAQNGADINKNTKSNILRATINPFGGSKVKIELKGLHAKVQSHVGNPFIYLSLDPEADSGHSNDPDKQKGNWRIVQLKEKKGNRLVGDVNLPIYGKPKEKADYVETLVTPVAGQWIKIEPSSPLPAGEYALVEMLRDGMNRFVWDFGVDPNAPANTGVWRAQPVQPNAAPADKKPELKIGQQP
jgi:hypothetical protein